MNVEVSTLGSL